MPVSFRTQQLLDKSLFYDANLKYYWTMNGNSNASTGSQDGTDTSITYTGGVFTGKDCAVFNAETDRISFGTVFAPRAINGTINMWIFPTSNGESGDADYKFTSIYTKGNVYGRLGITSANKVRAYYYDGASVIYYDSDSTLTINNWYMITYIWSNGASSIYINGILDTSDTKSFYAMDIAGDTGTVLFGLGEEVGAGNYGYLGYLDDVSFWDRNLTADEIYGLYRLPPAQRLQMII